VICVCNFRPWKTAPCAGGKEALVVAAAVILSASVHERDVPARLIAMLENPLLQNRIPMIDLSGRRSSYVRSLRHKGTPGAGRSSLSYQSSQVRIHKVESYTNFLTTD